MNDKYVKLADVKRKLRYIFKAYGVDGFVRDKVERALNNKPTETLKTVANNILMITEISDFDGWGSKDGDAE